MKILITGSIAYDLLLQYDGSFADAVDPAHLQTLSMAFVTPRFVKHHGGTGANIAWNLRLLGRDPLLVGTVGGDGGSYLALLEERGVITKHVQTLADRATSTAIVATDSGERQITFYHPGADAGGSWPEALLDEREDIAIAIVSPRSASVMVQAVDWFAHNKVPFLFDPGQQVMALTDGDLRRAVRESRGVIANAYEWGLLSERLKCSVEDILKEAPMLIVTHGDEGLTVHSREATHVIPPCMPDQVVNPTGAGDGLRAGFLAGLAAGWELQHCGRLGASVASFVVEQEGTLLDRLDLDEVKARAEKAFGEPLPGLN